MATTLVTEIVIGIIALVAGSFFWQLHKCDKFLTHAIRDASFLSQLISTAVLDSPPPLVAPYIQSLQPGYYLFNIDAVIYSHKKTQLTLKILFGSVVAAVLIGSYFLGIPYLAINTFLFVLSVLAPITQQGRANAEKQILALSVILDRWRSENATECEQWIKQTWALRPVYNAVSEARGRT